MSEVVQGCFTSININKLPPEEKKNQLPFLVYKLISGAEVFPKFENKPDIVGVLWNDKYEYYHIEDFNLSQRVAKEIWKEQIEGKNLLTTFNSLPVTFDVLKIAREKITKIANDSHKGKRKVLLTKDQSGCGYWRVAVPFKYLNTEKFYADLSQSQVIYDFLLDYDTIVVQRSYNWSEYYVIERLKRAGKKIVYDIDDDLFNIPSHNPASKHFGNDEKAGAKAIMGIVDVITTTTEILKNQLGFPNKTVVIPNSIDLEDGYTKFTGVDAVDEKLIGVNDGIKRIFWQGSPTHEMDWYECINAVDQILLKHDNVRLVILGYMPKIVEKFHSDSSKPYWKNKVEYGKFENVETYISLCKQIKPDICIAPLEESIFNQSKSCIKYLEYTGMGAPSVVSNVSPYKEVVKNGVNGFAVKGAEEWFNALDSLIEDKKLGLRLIRGARETVQNDFDIKKNVKLWESVF